MSKHGNILGDVWAHPSTTRPYTRHTVHCGPCGRKKIIRTRALDKVRAVTEALRRQGWRKLLLPYFGPGRQFDTICPDCVPKYFKGSTYKDTH